MEVIGKAGACVCVDGIFLPERPGFFIFYVEERTA